MALKSGRHAQEKNMLNKLSNTRLSFSDVYKNKQIFQVSHFCGFGVGKEVLTYQKYIHVGEKFLQQEQEWTLLFTAVLKSQ